MGTSKRRAKRPAVPARRTGAAITPELLAEAFASIEVGDPWRRYLALAVGDRLFRHVLGAIELTPAQVASARILLDRAVPTLSSTEEVKRNVVNIIISEKDAGVL
jgi:hypothetical protein